MGEIHFPQDRGFGGRQDPHYRVPFYNFAFSLFKEISGNEPGGASPPQTPLLFRNREKAGLFRARPAGDSLKIALVRFESLWRGFVWVELKRREREREELVWSDFDFGGIWDRLYSKRSSIVRLTLFKVRM